MKFNYTTQLLRGAFVSKGLMLQGDLISNLQQVAIAVKAENTYDPIQNVPLLSTLVGKSLKLQVSNRKQVRVLPQAVLSGNTLKVFISNILPLLITRVNEKTVAMNFNPVSKNVTFTFKGSDALPIEMRNLFKLFNAEVGSFTFEMTFKFSTSNARLNETLLRGLNLPVIIS